MADQFERLEIPKPPPLAAVAADGDGARLSPKAREIRSMFSAIAGSYDFLNHLLSLSADRLWRRRAARAALDGLPAGSSPPMALDVCCGTGDLAFALRRRGASVAGLDFSHPMLRLAQRKERAQRNDSGALRFVEGDALRLPLQNGVFDICTVAFGLRNFADRQAGLREMARVTRPGGQMLILEFSQPRRRWLRPLYGFYLRRALPEIGNRFTRSQAYRYLADTVGAFPQPEEVRGWMAEAGLRSIRYDRWMGGVVVLYRGIVS